MQCCGSGFDFLFLIPIPDLALSYNSAKLIRDKVVL